MVQPIEIGLAGNSSRNRVFLFHLQTSSLGTMVQPIEIGLAGNSSRKRGCFSIPNFLWLNRRSTTDQCWVVGIRAVHRGDREYESKVLKSYACDCCIGNLWREEKKMKKNEGKEEKKEGREEWREACNPGPNVFRDPPIKPPSRVGPVEPMSPHNEVLRI